MHNTKMSPARNMPKITIYTTKLCPYCINAKRLLAKKQAAFDEIDVTYKPDRRNEMAEKANGASTLPQIWIGEKHVGGFDELFELEMDGELDDMLAAE